jgi:F0F1-type ATP synthase epsilon subunit
VPLDLVIVERDRVVLKVGETILELEPEDVRYVKQCGDAWYVEYVVGRNPKTSVVLNVEFKAVWSSGEEGGCTVYSRPAPPVRRAELVKIYLLSMHLPSRYLIQEIEREEGVERRLWPGEKKELADKIERIRSKAYERVERIFSYVEDLGVWIAVTDEAVVEARSVMRMVRLELSELHIEEFKPNFDIDRYIVRAVPVYLEPEDARRVLEAAIRKLSADAEELARKIEEAERAKARKDKIKDMRRDYSRIMRKLEEIKSYLKRIAES